MLGPDLRAILVRALKRGKLSRYLRPPGEYLSDSEQNAGRNMNHTGHSDEVLDEEKKRRFLIESGEELGRIVFVS